MKKFKYFISAFLLIVILVALKMYKKYNRQQYNNSKNEVNTEQIFKIKRQKDSIKRAKADSISRNSYRVKQDSIKNEIAKKRAKMDSILRELEKKN